MIVPRHLRRYGVCMLAVDQNGEVFSLPPQMDWILALRDPCWAVTVLHECGLEAAYRAASDISRMVIRELVQAA